MTRRARGWLIVTASLAVLAIAIGAYVVWWRHNAVADELSYARPFLELDGAASVTVEEHPGAFFADGLGSGIDAVVVVYRTDDTRALIEQLSAALTADGWSAQSDSTWYGPTMATIWVDSQDPGAVRLRIGAIEG